MFKNYAITKHAYSKGARYNTGDGFLMAGEVQAKIVNMANNNGPYPNIIYLETGISFGSMIMGNKDSAWSGTSFACHNAIIVGKDGKRFVNEPRKTRHGRVPFHDDYVHLLMPDRTFLIFDEKARKASKIYGS